MSEPKVKWIYEPQRDITVYELALVVRCVIGIRKDPTQLPEWSLIRRHFREWEVGTPLPEFDFERETPVLGKWT